MWSTKVVGGCKESARAKKKKPGKVPQKKNKNSLGVKRGGTLRQESSKKKQTGLEGKK